MTERDALTRAIHDEVLAVNEIFGRLNPVQQRRWAAEYEEAASRVREAIARRPGLERGAVEYVLNKHLCLIARLFEDSLAS